MTCHHSSRELHCMPAHNLEDLKERVFLVKAINGVLLSSPDYPFRPSNTAPQRSMPQLAPHRGLLPLPTGTAGWGLCRDSSLPTAGKRQCLSQGFAACPGSGRGATGHREEETALLPTQVQAGKGQRERGRSNRFVLHPWLLHDWSTQKCQTQKRQHSAWHFRHTSHEKLWSAASSWSLQSWAPLSARVCGRRMGHIKSCLPMGGLIMPWGHVPSHATFPSLACTSFEVLQVHIATWHRLTPTQSQMVPSTPAQAEPPLGAAPAEEQTLPKTHMWILDSCWFQFSITVQLVQLPQSTRFLAGKRWFLELEFFFMWKWQFWQWPFILW